MDKKIYELTPNERIKLLKETNLWDDTLNVVSESELDALIENYLTTFEVPMGLVNNLFINDEKKLAVIATEEPSVIAAACHGAKIVKANGGFKCFVINRLMIGQIIFHQVKDYRILAKLISDNTDLIHKLAKSATPKIYELGGGLVDFRLIDKTDGFAVLECNFDTKDAMGANTINTILEHIAHFFKAKLSLPVLMAINSNQSDCLVYVSCQIPLTYFKDPKTGQLIQLASHYSMLDQNRAVTHNKGILNGVVGVALATGNDTRALSSTIHLQACETGKYLPLSTWQVENDQVLVGTMMINLPIATFGGATSLPKAQLARKIMAIETAEDLMKIMACCGLANNLAALLALVTDGIQKGHIQLVNKLAK